MDLQPALDQLAPLPKPPESGCSEAALWKALKEAKLQDELANNKFEKAKKETSRYKELHDKALVIEEEAGQRLAELRKALQANLDWAQAANERKDGRTGPYQRQGAPIDPQRVVDAALGAALAAQAAAAVAAQPDSGSSATPTSG